MDNNPLNYILTTAKLNATGLHWVNELADFSFVIRYCPGTANAGADTLSRMPLSFEQDMDSCSAKFNNDALDAAMELIQEGNTGKTAWLLSFTVASDPLGKEHNNGPPLPPGELIAAQH